MEIINAAKNTPIPTLLIIVGLFLIILGFVTKIGIINLEPKQGRWAVFSGFFLLFIGLALGFHAEQNVERISNSGSQGSDLEQLAGYSEGQCIDKCRQRGGCIAVVFAPTVPSGNNNCFLKGQLNDPLEKSFSSEVIKIK